MEDLIENVDTLLDVSPLDAVSEIISVEDDPHRLIKPCMFRLLKRWTLVQEVPHPFQNISTSMRLSIWVHLSTLWLFTA